MSTHPSITLFTPTFKRDFERFCLQRESIERCGVDLPHIAAVNHEDMELFRTVPCSRNLTLVSTQDLLPPSIEARRKVFKISRKDYRYWITGRGIHGWAIQQLLKFAAPSVVKTDAFVCLDSDTFFIDRVVAQDFSAPDGRLHLYETEDDIDAEMAEWYAHSLRFFGLKPAGEKLLRFTHSPVPMHRGVVVDLQRTIELQHGKPWIDAILNADRIMEYTTYGTFARHVDALKRVCPVRPPLTLYYWWAEQVATLEDTLLDRVRTGNEKMLLVQSNSLRNAGEFRHLIEQAWDIRAKRSTPRTETKPVAATR